MGDHDVGRELRKRRPTCFGEHFGKRASMLSAACIRSSPGHPEPLWDAMVGHHQGSEWSDGHHQVFKFLQRHSGQSDQTRLIVFMAKRPWLFTLDTKSPLVNHLNNIFEKQSSHIFTFRRWSSD